MNKLNAAVAVDKFIEDVAEKRKREKAKPATVGDVEISEIKMRNHIYKALSEFKESIGKGEKQLAESMVKEVRIISKVLEGYFTQTNENINETKAHLARVEKLIRKNGHENRQIREEFYAVKAQVENLCLTKH